MRSIVNRVWQLRPYSYVDLLLLTQALNATLQQTIVVSLLWFGFLIHLEWTHRDRGRDPWHPGFWLASWVCAVVLAPTIWSFFFIIGAVVYSQKKRIRIIGTVSFLVNGALKMFLVGFLPEFDATWAITVFSVMALRNLLGDFRDIDKDRRDHATTIPTAMGMQKDVRWLYPSALALSSTLWWVKGDLETWMLPAAWTIQLLTYRLTPR